jgi:hypothetical protein
MKKLRNAIVILLSADALLYISIQLFQIKTLESYGGCVDGLCTDSVRTNPWGVALYAVLGGLFIVIVALTLLLAILRLNAQRKSRQRPQPRN